MYALILTMIITSYDGQAVDIESVPLFESYEQCLAARSSWLQDHSSISVKDNLNIITNYSAVCVKTGEQK